MRTRLLDLGLGFSIISIDMASGEPIMEELQTLQKKLGKKQSFEEAVSSILSLLRDRYSSSSPSLRKSVAFDIFPSKTPLFLLVSTPNYRS